MKTSFKILCIMFSIAVLLAGCSHTTEQGRAHDSDVSSRRLDKKWSEQTLGEVLKRDMKDVEVMKLIGTGEYVSGTSAADWIQYRLYDGRYLVLTYFMGRLRRVGISKAPGSTIGLAPLSRPASTQPAATDAGRGAFHGEWASANGRVHFVIDHKRGQTPVVRNPNDKKWRPENLSLADGVLQWETGRYLIRKKGFWEPADFDVKKTGHPFMTMPEKEFLRVDPASSSRLLFYPIFPDGKVHLDWSGLSLELKSRKSRSGQ